MMTKQLPVQRLFYRNSSKYFIVLLLIGLNIIFLFLTLIPLSGVGIQCFLSCCVKDLATIFTTGRLPNINLP
jgi:hypothetical protein